MTSILWKSMCLFISCRFKLWYYWLKGAFHKTLELILDLSVKLWCKPVHQTLSSCADLIHMNTEALSGGGDRGRNPTPPLSPNWRICFGRLFFSLVDSLMRFVLQWEGCVCLKYPSILFSCHNANYGSILDYYWLQLLIWWRKCNSNLVSHFLVNDQWFLD